MQCFKLLRDGAEVGMVEEWGPGGGGGGQGAGGRGRGRGGLSHGETAFVGCWF